MALARSHARTYALVNVRALMRPHARAGANTYKQQRMQMHTNEEAIACECVRVRIGPGRRAVRVWVYVRACVRLCSCVGVCMRVQMLVRANASV